MSESKLRDLSMDFSADIIELVKYLKSIKEYSTMNEILGSFVEAITDYFAWICNEISENYGVNKDDVEDVLQEYWNSHE